MGTGVVYNPLVLPPSLMTDSLGSAQGLRPLGTLLSDSWSHFRRSLVPILIGAVIFGLILGLSQSFIGQRVTQKTGTALERLGFSQQEMQDLQRRIQAGDQAAMEEFTRKMQQVGGEQGEKLAGAMVSAYGSVLPVIGASALLIWLISLIASAYFLVLSLESGLTFQGALSKAPGLIIPFFLLSLWIMIRSFIWIPVIGIITAIILGPRFVLAPVLLAQEHKGVLESASLSFTKTQGYWGKIFGNIFVAALLAMVAVMVIGIVVGILGASSAGLLMPVFNMLATAFLMIFSVRLSQTILQHPRNT